MNFAGSLLSTSFVQPLLRGAGRSIALEDLTQVERNLLANLRAYAQYRQGFYTQIAIGELGIIPLHYQVNTWATRKGLAYTPRTDEYTLVMSVVVK